MKLFLPLIILCGLVGCQKGSTNESQTANNDSGAAGASSTAKADPSIEELLGRLVAGDSGSSATYRMRGNILVVNVRDEGDMSWSYRLGIFYKKDGQWQSTFKTETIMGALDTLIDLDGDNSNELIVNDERGQSAGSFTATILYGGIEAYEIIDTLGLTKAGFDAYTSRGVTTRLFERDGDRVNIRVTKEFIPGMDPTVDPAVQGDQPTTSTERIWSWNRGKLTKSLPTDFLVINGKDIWVRDAPTTGKVVMKLNSRDRCKILEKGKEETIRGNTDNWYRIDFNGKTGWVFGSQTSVGRNLKI